MSKRFIVLSAVAVVIVVATLIFKLGGFESAMQASVTAGGGGFWLLLVLSALIDSLNPCGISILLLTIAFLFSIGRLRSNILKVGGMYIAGIFIVYVLVGLGFLQTFQILHVPNFMAKVGAFILFFVGLVNIINYVFPAFPIKFKIPHFAHEKIAKLMEVSSYATAFVLGALVGVFEFPCTGGPYLMVLGLLHDQKTHLAGIGYMFLYNFLFVLPLIIILFVASDPVLIERAQELKKTKTDLVRFVTGALMILLGIIIFIL
ncbi:MAG: cytochrome c biogenesis protein CcdA [Candidatus Paceibacterota bacterium]|jgi:cytochrome c biogenesis protein CcdA